MNKMLWELYVTFGVATVLFILLNKKFIETHQELPGSPDILCTEPMELCSPVSPLSIPSPMETIPERFVVQPMSEDESSSEDFVIKEKFY